MTTIHGQVLSPHGQPVPEAAVYIVSAPVNMPDIAQLTDDQGQFIISAPVSGKYKIGVRSDTWGLAETVVEVSDESSVTIKVQLI